MVDCRKCKYFKEETVENIYAGICDFAEYFDFMEEWQIDGGACDYYECVDRNDSKE